MCASPQQLQLNTAAQMIARWTNGCIASPITRLAIVSADPTRNVAAVNYVLSPRLHSLVEGHVRKQTIEFAGRRLSGCDSD